MQILDINRKQNQHNILVRDDAFTFAGTRKKKKIEEKNKATYIYPVKMFNNVDLPAPDGPIIAVSSHDLNSPETPLSTVFWAVVESMKIKIIAE